MLVAVGGGSVEVIVIVGSGRYFGCRGSYKYVEQRVNWRSCGLMLFKLVAL